jgi:hypothetical protein
MVGGNPDFLNYRFGKYSRHKRKPYAVQPKWIDGLFCQNNYSIDFISSLLPAS